jgi:hypothetical protein
MHLATHPNGTVGLCCEADTLNGYALSGGKKDTRKSLRIHTINEVINSENFNSYRLDIINNRWAQPCITCKNKEDMGQISKRIRENKKYLPLFPKETLIARARDDGSLKEINFAFVELRLANTCNSACVTCNPISSSRWIPDSEKLSKSLLWYKNIYSGLNNWSESSQTFEQIAEHCKDVREIYINGGEPTLIPEHYALLNKLIQNNNSDEITLHYSINMTRLPDELIDYWKKFKRVNVSGSIDEVGLRNYYIRYPTNWQDVENNVHKLLNLNLPNVTFGITQTVSIFNAHRLEQFAEYVRSNWNGCGIYHNYVQAPDYLRSNITELDLNKFKEYVAALDKIRNLSFAETFPELAKKYDIT